MPTEGFVILTLVFRRDNRRWTGECEELGTATYARTLSQTSRELVELVTLHLDALETTGERERFFREHNIRFYADEAPPSVVTPQIPVDTDDGQTYFQARPFPLRPAGVA